MNQIVKSMQDCQAAVAPGIDGQTEVQVGGVLLLMDV